jgi:hypothetical protein
MSARRSALGWVALAMLGCSGTPIRLEPPDVNPAMVPAITAGASVAVHAELGGRGAYSLPTGMSEQVDDDAFTAALVARVSAALEALHVVVDPQAERSIRLRVTHVSARLAGMHFECIVDFNRQLGQGSIAGLQARGVDRDIHEACSLAVGEVATTALADGAVRTHLEAP